MKTINLNISSNITNFNHLMNHIMYQIFKIISNILLKSLINQLKDCAPFTDRTSKINNKQEDKAKSLDIVMPTYDLMKYSDNYFKISRHLWKYYRDGLNGNTKDSKSFKSKTEKQQELLMMVILKMLK